MAFRLPRRPNLRSVRVLHRLGSFGVLWVSATVIAATFFVPRVQAQIIVGAARGPAVTVNNSVLDRLGPPLTLPQLFRGMTNPPHASRPVATTTHHGRTRHVATRRTPTHKTKVAMARKPVRNTPVRNIKTAQAEPSSLHQIIHLIPPKSRVASAAPVGPERTTLTQSAAPSVVASAAPMPRPSPQAPRSDDAPTPPILPAQPAAISTPSTLTAPPPQQASAPTAAAMSVTAANPAPSQTVAAPAPSPAATPSVASASPAPRAPSAPASSEARVAPPLQMAAATTFGANLSAIKFAPGATDLQSGPQPVLDAVAASLAAADNLRVQVIAHASGTADEAMEARRVSLARAVAVRGYLMSKGVSSLRIDVRALGNRSDDGPVHDQVDLMVVSQ